MKNEAEDKKKSMAKRMVGNETHQKRSYSEKMGDSSNLEQHRSKETYKRFMK